MLYHNNQSVVPQQNPSFDVLINRSFPFVHPPYVMRPQLQSACHYIENSCIKIWQVCLGVANKMNPLSWGHKRKRSQNSSGKMSIGLAKLDGIASTICNNSTYHMRLQVSIKTSFQYSNTSSYCFCFENDLNLGHSFQSTCKDLSHVSSVLNKKHPIKIFFVETFIFVDSLVILREFCCNVSLLWLIYAASP